ncbi:hypothetical protein Tco_1064807 [Tanacetum coccineum]
MEKGGRSGRRSKWKEERKMEADEQWDAQIGIRSLPRFGPLNPPPPHPTLRLRLRLSRGRSAPNLLLFLANPIHRGCSTLLLLAGHNRGSTPSHIRSHAPRPMNQASIERLVTERVTATVEAERARQANARGQRNNANEAGGQGGAPK